MLRFLSKLVREFQTANATRTSRRAQRRSMLHLEGLEDRMLLSTTAGVLQIGKTLAVTVLVPNDTITFIGDKHPGQLDVVEDRPIGKPLFLGHFPIASINNVDVSLVSNDTVTVDDSRGYPFAKGTTISLHGTGSGNSLTLEGSRTLNASEIYLPGTDAGTGQVRLLNATTGKSISTFNVDATVTSMIDSIKTTGRFDVQVSSVNVSLSGSDGVTQTLSGLAINGSAINNLTFSNKGVVQLEEYAANATVTLDATAAETGEQSFTLLLNGAGDVAFIEAAPVTTNVMANGANVIVNLEANAAPVSIQGNSTTHVNLGGPASNGITTAGIQANVNVQGAGLLLLIDDGNNTAQENVKVTPTTISGTGLFGSTNTVLHALAKASTIVGIGPIVNNAPEVQYSGIGQLQILAGQGFEKYSVSGTNFTNPIEIDGSSKGGLQVSVSVNASSNLDLVLHNNSRALNSADLIFVALGATVNRPPFSETGAPILSGAEVAAFPNGGRSIVDYSDFSEVLAINHFPVI
jgi:hypothetical protein